MKTITDEIKWIETDREDIIDYQIVKIKIPLCINCGDRMVLICHEHGISKQWYCEQCGSILKAYRNKSIEEFELTIPFVSEKLEECCR